MKTKLFKPISWWVLTLCCVLLTAARAQDVQSPSTGTAIQAPDDAAQTAEDASQGRKQDAGGDDGSEVQFHPRKHHGSNNAIVSIGHKAELAAGEHADSVVAIFGSATSAGDVDDAVVSILGRTRVTGKVGDAAVAVMGSVYVNGEVGGDVVAVLGNVELGPEAKVHGNVVVVGGELTRDPAATVNGNVQRVLEVDWAELEWLRPWIDRCLLYGRPLAFGHGLGWAWGMALGFLALYLFMAFLFHGAVERCVRTLETSPGQSFLAAILTVLLTPVLIVLLCITVLGIAAIPFLGLGLLGAAVFGKVVVLAAIGRRCTPMLASQPVAHTVVGVLVGAAIALFLYTIPVVGFIVYKLLGILGLGVVVYTLLLVTRSEREARAAAAGGPGVAGSRAAGGSTGPSMKASAAAAAGPSADAAAAAAAGPSADAAAAAAAEPSADAAAAAPAGPAVSAPVTSYPRAGFLIRMAALLLDALLVGIVLHQVHEGMNLQLLVLATYGAVMWKLKGSTIGGIICGLQVVRLDGRPLDWPTAIVRALSCFLSLAVVGLGFFWIAIDSEKQSWHDKIAGTIVVRAPKGASLL